MTGIAAPDRRRAPAAAASIFLGAAIWGLFWIPLHYFDRMGVQGLWSTVLVMALPVPLSIFAAWRLREFERQHLWAIVLIGAGAGISLALYFAALVLSDVVRVIFLFYLMPIWASIAARFIVGEPFGPARAVAVALALLGLWLLLGGDGGWPLPSNMGDWFSFLGGVIWGVTVAYVRKHADVGAFANIASTYTIGFVFALILALALPEARAQMPSLAALGDVLLLAVLFTWVGMWPSSVGMLWGARYLSPGTTGLLTMSEVVAGTLSAMLLIGTALGLLGGVGAVLITAAVVLDLWSQQRRAANTKGP